MNKIHWQDVVTLIVGLWLIASAYFLDLGTADGAGFPLVGWTLVLTGLAAVVLAGAAIFAFQKWEEWLTALVGVWLIVSPWIIGYDTSTLLMWNALVAGVILVAMGLWTNLQESETATY